MRAFFASGRENLSKLLILSSFKSFPANFVVQMQFLYRVLAASFFFWIFRHYIDAKGAAQCDRRNKFSRNYKLTHEQI